MTVFSYKNDYVFVYSNEAINQSDTLPIGNYIVHANMKGEYFLQTANPFTLEEKLYGNVNKRSNKILHSFNDRQTNTGVLFVGTKGSGKSLLAKKICIDAQIPVLIVNSALCGAGFNQFLDSIEQPCIVLFDEFEKVYNNEDQEKLLSLLDGTSTNKKLYLLTANSKFKIDTNMINRPGRLFYMIEFKGLDDNFITEYCQDNLCNLDHMQEIIFYGKSIKDFSFDMLKAIVEECNRFKERPSNAIEILNIKPEMSGEISYDLIVTKNNNKVFEGTYKFNPMSQFSFNIYIDQYDDNDDEICLRVSPDKFVKGTPDRFILLVDGYVLTFSKKEILVQNMFGI